MRFIGLFVLVCSMQACGSITTPPARPTCADVCSTYAKLGCDESRPTAAGASCEDICKNLAELSEYRDYFGCVVVADSCEYARACSR